MKTNSNIIAATILGGALVVAAIIRCLAPQSGRYVKTSHNTGTSHFYTLFDSATGTTYTHYLEIKPAIDLWEKLSLDDIERKVRKNPPIEEQVKAWKRDEKLADQLEKRLDENK